ncbi:MULTISPECIES: ABC transporter permease [Rossellomorea]|uniref:ABC transporter permease n=1 Tax=Rossellomorea TaxID=2837508 RepID=UPI00077C51DF|nr:MULTISPECIES: ABC transporter permease [Rossellomorea]OXS63060.1 ABC transporter permease [Bacillus sp. DSM 27956]PRX77908.1 ABC-2 type transport system permease protein [Bacillus sp. V-88]UTE76445.1 ABC transporter permease [Rossellomorea sp. KS-H15a]WGG44338.1 ABC transporter permease [Rossellomorea sp. DA94]SLK19262.1 ABC-2 type transport system permease protein [Bacillus sp. V-88]
MLSLIRNEWTKIFKRVGTFVMLGLLILIIGVTGAFTKYSDSKAKEMNNWKQELSAQVESDKQMLAETPNLNKFIKKDTERRVAINEYRIENDIEPKVKETAWTFVETNANIVLVVGLFTIIVAAGIVASEFSWGTIKLLLIRPISRTKILLSKYFTVILYGMSMLLLLFVVSLLLGLLLFGGTDQSTHLAFVDGKVVEQNIVGYLIKTYLLQTVNIVMMATMAFMISAVFRSSSLAIGISLFLLFVGGNATSLLALKFDWAKYSLFANTDLTQYTGFTPPLVDGMTMGFSITMLIIYFIIFQLLAFLVFNKRDVAA